MLKILRDLSMTWMMITMCSIRSLFNISLIFSSLNLNDVLILVLDEFRARKIFILVWSNIIWSLQFIWSVPIVCESRLIYRIYMVILWTQFANKKLHLYLITQKHVIISLCKKISTILLPTLNIKRFLSDFL